MEDSLLIKITQQYKDEAEDAKKDRMDTNKSNYDSYHLKQDYSHKTSGQSKEFLAKQTMAVEQICSFMHQGLVDIGDWFGVENKDGVKNPLIQSYEMKGIMADQFEKVKFLTTVHDALKSGLLGSLMIVKVHGEFKTAPIYYTVDEIDGEDVKKKLKKEERKYWCPKYDVVRQQDYYPDPTGRGLYALEAIEMDLHQVKELSEGENAIFDKKVVEELELDYADFDQETERARETNQNIPLGPRNKVKILEGYGTIVDASTGKVLHKNVVWAIANDKFILRKPKPIPFWHGKIPYVTAPIIRVPNSVWHKALMDAPTALNKALNELFNLILDGGMMSVYGIKQIRTNFLEDENQVSDGIYPGITLGVTSGLPTGQKVVERIDTAQVPAEALNVFNLTNAEFNQSALTNDLRMGVMPTRAVKATEVVEASQTITSVFTGIAKVIEDDFIKPILEMTWLNIAQHFKYLDPYELSSVLGENRSKELLTTSSEDIFVATVRNRIFRVYGISITLNKMKDFRKLTTLLQTIGASEILVDAFSKKYSFTKLLEEIIKSLDINVKRIMLEPEEMDMSAASLNHGAVPPGVMPNEQSQIRQESAASPTSEENPSNIPQAQFPPSRATPR